MAEKDQPVAETLERSTGKFDRGLLTVSGRRKRESLDLQWQWDLVGTRAGLLRCPMFELAECSPRNPDQENTDMTK
jgi:hypothetical protein